MVDSTAVVEVVRSTPTDLDPTGTIQRQLSFSLIGTRPLLHHNVRLSDPQDPFARKLRSLHMLKKKKGANKDIIEKQMADVEWEGGLYLDGDLGPCIMGEMLFASIREAARISRGGKTIERGLEIPEWMPVIYEGPRDIKTMRDLDRFRLRRMVKVGQARVPRVRPRFSTPWSVDVTLHFSPEVLNEEDLTQYITQAGMFCGVGAGRSIGFGRFRVEFND